MARHPAHPGHVRRGNGLGGLRLVGLGLGISRFDGNLVGGQCGVLRGQGVPRARSLGGLAYRACLVAPANEKGPVRAIGSRVRGLFAPVMEGCVVLTGVAGASGAFDQAWRLVNRAR